MLTRTFIETGDFEAYEAAEAMAQSLGLSVGDMQRDEPIGLMHGDYAVMKWRNLSARDRDALHGVITGDKRHGPVRLSLNINCPQHVRDAFVALGAGYDNTPEPA
jgi:hypothetical protein